MEERNTVSGELLRRKVGPSRLKINLDFDSVVTIESFEQCDQERMRDIPIITRTFVQLYLYGSSEDIQYFWFAHTSETLGKITPQDVGFMIAAFRRVEQSSSEIPSEDLAGLKDKVKKLKKQLKKKKRKIKKLESRLYCKKDKKGKGRKDKLKKFVNRMYGNRTGLPLGYPKFGNYFISPSFEHLAHFLRADLNGKGVSPFLIRDPRVNKMIIFEDKSTDWFSLYDLIAISSSMIKYIKNSSFTEEPRVLLIAKTSNDYFNSKVIALTEGLQRCKLSIVTIEPTIFSEANLTSDDPKGFDKSFRTNPSLFDIIIIPDWNILVEELREKGVTDFSLYIARIIKFLDKRTGVLLIFGTKTSDGVTLDIEEIHRKFYDFSSMCYEDKSITVIE